MASRSKPRKTSSRVEPTLSNKKPQNLGQTPSKPRTFKVSSDQDKRSKSVDNESKTEKPKSKISDPSKAKPSATSSKSIKTNTSKVRTTTKDVEKVTVNKQVVRTRKAPTATKTASKSLESKSKPTNAGKTREGIKKKENPKAIAAKRSEKSTNNVKTLKKTQERTDERRSHIKEVIQNGQHDRPQPKPVSPPPLKSETLVESTNMEKNLGSLDTLESGVSMTSPHDSSDPDVEESISSRFVEVDYNEDNDDPSPPSSFTPIASATKDELEENEVAKGSDDSHAYEDDFDSYESDFENAEESSSTSVTSSSSEESSLSRDTESDDSLEADDPIPTHLISPKTPIIQPALDNTQRPKSSKAYVNFARAKQKQSDKQASEKIKTRGELLQDMVQLDTMKMTLFVQIPDSYDAYIRTFGHASSVQVALQTNEDSLSESVQTEPCLMLSKWTQKPAQVVMTAGLLPSREDYLGVGGEIDESTDNAKVSLPSVSARFSKFLASSSMLILHLLEESIMPEEHFSTAEEDSGFGQLGIKLGSAVSSLLNHRKTTLVRFCEFDPSVILSGHEARFDEEETNHQQIDDSDDATSSTESLVNDASLVCVWSSNQPSSPTDILCCRSVPLCTSFSPGKPVTIVAGLRDGSLCAWDLREDLSNHSLVTRIEDSHWRIKPPSFITACSEEDNVDASPIICIETLTVQETNQSRQGSFQVVSLSSDGLVTWWVVIQERGQLQAQANAYVSLHLGASPWSRISIARAASLDINTYISNDEGMYGGEVCSDIKISSKEPNQLFVAASTGSVLHCSRHNAKLHPPAFLPEIQPATEAVSISVCPHDSNFLMVGGSDGLVRLHTMQSPFALTYFQASKNPDPIVKVQWSFARPCVIYMLDAKANFHVWDLMAGDIYPTVSYGPQELIKDAITSFDIAQIKWQDGLHTPYAAFASEFGSIILRPVAQRYLSRNEQEYENELHRFRCYASII